MISTVEMQRDSLTSSTTERISVGSGIRAGVTPDNYSQGLALPSFASDIFPSQRSCVFSATGFALTAEIKVKLSSLLTLLVPVMVF